MEPHGGEQRPHASPPSLWPVGFAVGIAILLTGAVLGWFVAAVGAILTVVFGFLWVRDVTGGMRTVPERAHEAEVAPAPPTPAPPIPAHEGPAAMPVASDEEVERFPRSKFLEGATLGIGAAIGGIVTLPVAGMAVLPAFTGEEERDIDIGALDDFPQDEWRVVTYLANPEAGEVTRRTVFVRNNGTLDGAPSFTVLSNRCVHLGCPVQPSGPVADEESQREKTENTVVIRIPTQPSGFGCPCHGGQYDNEGNRTAGPPVRALDRHEFSVRNGRLLLGEPYSVSDVDGLGKEARIKKYDQMMPGVHLDGPEQFLYPIEAPQ